MTLCGRWGGPLPWCRDDTLSVYSHLRRRELGALALICLGVLFELRLFSPLNRKSVTRGHGFNSRRGKFFLQIGRGCAVCPTFSAVCRVNFWGGGVLLQLFLFRGGRWVAVAHQAVFFVGVDCMAVVLIFLGGMEFRHEGVQLGRCDLAHGRQRYLQRQ